jgi:hypothetical protein
VIIQQNDSNVGPETLFVYTVSHNNSQPNLFNHNQLWPNKSNRHLALSRLLLRNTGHFAPGGKAARPGIREVPALPATPLQCSLADIRRQIVAPADKSIDVGGFVVRNGVIALYLLSRQLHLNLRESSEIPRHVRPEA